MDFASVEKKWQERWEKAKIFEVKEDSKKPKYYVLDMFPYPSGAGLHMGHAFVFTLGDIFARFKRLQGYNVLYPIGYDALGLPAENAAIKVGTHPEDYTKKSMANFMNQQKAMGWSYDWSRLVNTSSPEFYKWDQWIFLKMLEKGIAYKKKAAVNWCPKCDSVLANEQVVSGKCWRHDDTDVEIKHLEQWFFKITNYAEELLDYSKLDWPERAKKVQANWIGKSYGTEIKFKIENKHKIILVDAVNAFVVKGEGINKEMHKCLEEFQNKKIILTNANDEEKEKFGLKKLPYELFTLEHNPDKKDPEYYKKMLRHFKLSADDVIYFEHNPDAVKSAESVGIKTFHYDKDKKDVSALKKFLESNLNADWPIFTTRPDTIYGVTFTVVSAQHPRLNELVTKEQKAEVDAFLKKIKSTSEKDAEELEKEGAFTGSYAVNPLTNEKIPVYAGNFVLADYGSGMVMAVPAHDQRDFEFAKKYKIPIKQVIEGKITETRAFTGEGKLTNSAEFNGVNSHDAIEKITKYLEKKKLGRHTFNYKLRDWLISRQRYWGTPIPIIYCDKCGIVPVPEKDLPVKLPKNVTFGKGNPLLTSEEFIKTKCPKCNGPARRETDTMDTFVNSSWYYLRYTDPNNYKEIFSKEKAKYWAPVDQYIGGPEHITMHLIYFRFYTKFLRDLGLLNFSEPALRYFTQGVVKGSDGEKMSKSRGNGVEPLETIKKYGADPLRMYLVSTGSPDSDFIWNDKGMESSGKFLNRLIEYSDTIKFTTSSKKIQSKLHKTIKAVTEDIQNFKYNLAVIKIRELFGEFEEGVSKEDFGSFLKLLHPFCPHVTEELWEKIGHKSFISTESWPNYDESKIDEKAEAADEIVSVVADDIRKVKELAKLENISKITLIVSPSWKYELFTKIKYLLEKTRNPGDIIKELMSSDLKKYGQEIMKIVPAIMKDNSKLPNVILDQKTELNYLKHNTEAIGKMFNAKVEVVIAEDSKEMKAKNASPGKPAILVQ